MITAGDTGVLSDVIHGDPVFRTASASALRTCAQEGALVVCDIVLAELMASVDDPARLRTLLENAGITFSPMTAAAAEEADRAWAQYRRGRSTGSSGCRFPHRRARPHQADRLLTRDRGFYRAYFPGLAIIDPAAA